jgi:two-component system phosphate regulon sensor histidine kinase PhoR
MLVLELRLILVGVLVILLVSILLALVLDRRFWRKSSRAVPLAPSDGSEARLRPFLNDLAHELRTPLAVLLTHLEVQRSPTVPPETKQESVRLMQAEARRMSRMVSNILELGELETRGLVAPRLVNLRAMAAEALAELQPLAEERDIALALDAIENAYWVKGDSYRLKQALLNLADNAIKYSRPHDRVEISIERDDARGKILCVVCDTGPGIAAEHLPHLTRRFYRGVSEAISGSGLGLALVAAILKLHDSELEIETKTSGDTTGTRVRFALDSANEMEVTE